MQISVCFVLLFSNFNSTSTSLKNIIDMLSHVYINNCLRFESLTWRWISFEMLFVNALYATRIYKIPVRSLAHLRYELLLLYSNAIVLSVTSDCRGLNGKFNASHRWLTRPEPKVQCQSPKTDAAWTESLVPVTDDWRGRNGKFSASHWWLM